MLSTLNPNSSPDKTLDGLIKNVADEDAAETILEASNRQANYTLELIDADIPSQILDTMRKTMDGVS